jgi:hypothetical protein
MIVITAVFGAVVTIPFDYVFDNIISAPSAEELEEMEEEEEEEDEEEMRQKDPGVKEGLEEDSDDANDMSTLSPTIRHTPASPSFRGRSSVSSPMSLRSPYSDGSFQSFRGASPLTLTRQKSVLIGKTTHNMSTELKRRQSDVQRLFSHSSADHFGSNLTNIQAPNELSQRQRRGTLLNNRKHEVYQKKLNSKKAMTFDNFKLDFMKQRDVLSKEEVKLFDKEWRWNHETRSFVGDTEPHLIPGIFPTLEQKIKKEILKADTNAQQHLKILTKYDSAKIGVDILHMFVVDMLGRDTVAAKTFMIKSHDE